MVIRSALVVGLARLAVKRSIHRALARLGLPSHPDGKVPLNEASLRVKRQIHDFAKPQKTSFSIVFGSE
jgi:hypothetical protein